MKIITPGQSDLAWSGEFKCTGAGNGAKGCGAVLLVEQTDLFTTQEFERDGGGEVHVTFECVQCGRLTDLTRTQASGAGGLPERREWLARKNRKPRYEVSNAHGAAVRDVVTDRLLRLVGGDAIDAAADARYLTELVAKLNSAPPI